MKKINIMTWNVDWFRNGNRSKKQGEYFEKDSLIDVYNGIVEKIKAYLEEGKEGNSIVFLQEVPYKVKDKSRWKDHFLYKELFKDFSNEEYDIFVNKDFACRCTMAIAVKGIFKKFEYYHPCNNRTIAVESNGYIFMGVHMPTQFKNEDDNDKMWNQLIDYVKTSTENIILAGDFNAYIGCEAKLTEEKYLNLLNYMGNCVSESIVTFGKTSIDKILIGKKGVKNINKYTIQPQDEKKLSDHKYVCMELLVKE